MKNYIKLFVTIGAMLFTLSVFAGENDKKPSTERKGKVTAYEVTSDGVKTEIKSSEDELPVNFAKGGGYVFIRVLPTEGLILAKTQGLNHMIVADGNAMDSPQEFPKGLGMIGFKRGTDGTLGFYVETPTGYKFFEGIKPAAYEAYYLMLWPVERRKEIELPEEGKVAQK